MGIKVSADGLSVVTTKSGGTANATIPDVCTTPLPSPPGPLPLPYPNISKSEDCKVTSVMTQFDSGQVACFGSHVEKSQGDEVGAIGGIISGKTSGKCLFLNSSSSVFVESRPVVRKSDFMICNEINTLALTGMDQPDVGGSGEIATEEKTLEIELKDDEGNAMANERFVIKHDGKITHEGNLDDNGCAKVEGIRATGYKVMFPDLENVEKNTAG
ncbi:MAG: DUF4150 domain-containing protein [Proteobacteria bacterium]|nr:DUF4150 domain-containing protein [Pseudomonadota bacterium]